MSTLSLSYETTMEFSTDKYKFGNNDSDTSNDIEIGLGTYILKGISKEYPISFDLRDNGNIELIGLYQYTTDNAPSDSMSISLINQPYTFVTISKDTNKFYYGNVALKVTGDFGTIPKYYFVDNNLEIYGGSLVTGEDAGVYRNIKFNKSNINGSKVDFAFELYELQNNRFPYFFEHNGTKDNGLLNKCIDNDNGINTDYYSYVKAYYDLNKSNCLYVGSNSLPNHHSYYIEELMYNSINKYKTEKTNLWNLNAFLSLDIYNYGIDKQSFGYINNKGQMVGKPFKIPLYTNTVEEKEIPNDLFEKDNFPRKKEAFWYTNNTNWKEIMIDRKHANINMGNNTPNSLTPIGPIGLAVNGIPFYNHFEMTDTITETDIKNVTDINLPIKQRNINLDNFSNKRINKVIERNYDTYGGTIDKNFNYHYNKYPVGLEAIIKYGNITQDSLIGYDNVFKNYIGENFTLSTQGNSINYFNINDVSLNGFTFSFASSGSDETHLIPEKIDELNNYLYKVGTNGNGISPYIYIKNTDIYKLMSDYDLDVTKLVYLQAKKNSVIKNISFEITNTGEAIFEAPPNFVSLRIEDNGSLLSYQTADSQEASYYGSNVFLGGIDATYFGILKHIDNTSPAINDIKIFIDRMVYLGGSIKTVSGTIPGGIGNTFYAKLYTGPIHPSMSAEQIIENIATFDYNFTGVTKNLSITVNYNGKSHHVGDILVIEGTDTRVTVASVDDQGGVTSINNITELDGNGYNSPNITIENPSTTRGFTGINSSHYGKEFGVYGFKDTLIEMKKLSASSVKILTPTRNFIIGQKILIYPPTSGIELTITSLDSTSGHSPILGFAFDGFPIYGQVAYRSDSNHELKLLRSSYDSNGKYIQGSGDLDICNGIFRATPEFPEGIYHYVCTLKTIFDTNTGKLTIDISNAENKENTIYQYPYIMGAYRGIPELDNFTLPTLSSTISTSLNGKDTNSSSSNKVGQSSQLIVNNNTYYEINMRTIKSEKDTFNYQFCNSIDIKQDKNHINIIQGIKPLIRNFSGNYKKEDTYFGKNTNNFGGTLAKMANTPSNSVYLKCYGNISKFNYSGTVYLGRCVSFAADFKVSNCNDDSPILGVVIKIDTTNTFCYVCTKGICEVSDISGTLALNNLLTSDTDGSIKKYDVIDLTETTINYILGTYIGQNGSNNYLINIKNQIVLG